ncbi:hypothetical protein SNE40_007221 [Patella caerulea]|uniref:Methyltransferase domain-containing protein n=1 Tax=Patella caerulea TaxID=87958 RepID=A0AAN8JY32_PATCE
MTTQSSKESDFKKFYKKEGGDVKYMESVAVREKMSKEQVANTFDKWVESGAYDTDVALLNYTGPVVTADVAVHLYPNNRENITMLDIAAGHGLLAIELRKQGFKHIDAVDPSPVSKKVAMEKNLYGRYLVDFVDERRLDIKTDEYDCVVSCGGFAPGLVPCCALNEMIRVTKPGGYVCISAPEYILRLSKEHTDRLEPLMDKYVNSGVWEKISRTVVDNYLNQKPGIIFVFRVLKSEVC